MKPHHEAWLKAHPERTEEWLKACFKDGFDVHHLDANHSNNDQENLVLIDGVDHMRLHGATKLTRVRPGPPPSCRSLADMREQYSYDEIDSLYQFWLACHSYKKVTEECGLTQHELKKLFRRHERDRFQLADDLIRKMDRAAAAPPEPKPRKRHVPRVRKREPKVTDADLAAWMKHVQHNVRPHF